MYVTTNFVQIFCFTYMILSLLNENKWDNPLVVKYNVPSMNISFWYCQEIWNRDSGGFKIKHLWYKCWISRYEINWHTNYNEEQWLQWRTMASKIWWWPRPTCFSSSCLLSASLTLSPDSVSHLTRIRRALSSSSTLHSSLAADNASSTARSVTLMWSLGSLLSC